jgi:nitric oxide reductase subunit B
LHREAKNLLALKLQTPITGLSNIQNIALQKAALQQEMRTNSYDSATGTIIVNNLRAEAIQKHFVILYQGSDP